MSAPSVPEALRQLADALEASTAPLAPKERAQVAHYYTRRTAPVEGRVWDRAVRELPTFRPGREILLRRDDLHRWIEEQHAVTPEADVAADDAPLDFGQFRRRAVARGQQL